MRRASSATAVEKTIWGSPAGKKRLAARLVKLIPVHKTYVEPFAGSAAVFFEKPACDTEVLSDADPEITFAFKALTTLTDGELAALKKKDWIGREQIFRALKEAKPRGKVEKLYRFLYLSHFAYGALRGKSYDHNDDGVEARTIERIEKYRDRLRGVTVRSGHYADVVKEFDGKNTFFFLDPPYPGHNVEVGEDRFDETEFRKVLDSIKGKFLITYGTRGQLDTTGFQVRKIRTPRTIASMRGVGGPKTLPQLLIANYAITQKSLGPYVLDEVEAAVELSDAAATDLEHARVLVKALAHDANQPLIAALAQALDCFEGISDERVETLARQLLPIGDRLAPAIEAAAPAIAGVLRDAMPVLAKLAKAQPGRSPGVQRAVEKAQLRPSIGVEPGAPNAAAPDVVRARLTHVLDKRIPLLKTGEERYVLGIVLEPETVDAQSDIYAAAEVREAAHRFMEEYQNVGLMHQDLVNGRVKILESYLAPAPFELDGTQVRKGTWLLAVRVLDDELWAQIKAGELTGFSIGGSAVRSAS
jgi:site-specific DNA-adenine methylase